MAFIEKDGIYRVGDVETGSQIQYLKGTEIGDQEVEYVGAFPDPRTTPETERAAAVSEASRAPDVKASLAPDVKAEAAPENKALNSPRSTKGA